MIFAAAIPYVTSAAAPYVAGGLAALALGEDNPVARTAILRALQSDRTYFIRKGDDYEPRSREQVEETIKREMAERLKQERRSAFLDSARAALKEPHPGLAAGPLPPEFRPYVADLVELALVGDEAASRKEALALADDAGAPGGLPAERAFVLLVALGVFHQDENLFIHRFRLRSSFPVAVEDYAARAVATAVEGGYPGRRDLRDLAAVTIDDVTTTEMDDALSVEMTGTGAKVGIHIADPGCIVAAGDPVDEEALSRAATFYFPEIKLPMLPRVIAEEAASLVPGADRPALSFLVTLSPLGEILEHDIVPSVIRSRARLTYEEVDLMIEGASDEPVGIAQAVRALRPLCDALEAERVGAGAVIIRAAEVDIKVRADGEVVIRRIDERGAARRMVAEMMILANRLAAQFCMRRGIPAIYRRQQPPAEAPANTRIDAAALETVEAGGYDPVAIRTLRRRMRRGEVSLTPAPHHGLGLPAYTQATSPIRRYQDLVVHRQIKAALIGQPPPYDADALARISAATDEAERAAREAERGTDEYWILKWYEKRLGQEVEGIIVASDARRVEVELIDTLYNVHLPARPDHQPGQRLRLVIEASRPRSMRLTLRMKE